MSTRCLVLLLVFLLALQSQLSLSSSSTTDSTEEVNFEEVEKSLLELFQAIHTGERRAGAEQPECRRPFQTPRIALNTRAGGAGDLVETGTALRGRHAARASLCLQPPARGPPALTFRMSACWRSATASSPRLEDAGARGKARRQARRGAS